MPPVSLPIDPILPEIVETLAGRGVVVLQAPPGAGKTTRVPPAILAAPWRAGDVVVLEPRRLAARLSARRVAGERDERVGDVVGYEVRLERVAGPGTRLHYVTEGILGRRLLDDPTLRGVGTVVFDEFHERHLQSDVTLALVRRLRETSRPDLRVVVMSATLDAAPVARFLDGPILTSEGRRFDVAIEHQAQGDDRPLQSKVASAVRRLVAEGLAGDVLVFLPGAAEIRRAMDACVPVARDADLLVVPLHGDLPPAAQDRAIARADRRKVILSTNVAETSITIDGVVAVIDSGLARVAGHDPWSGRPTLDIAKISRASATQRAGRAGRTAPGRAIRLYTKGDHDTRPEHDVPEVRRADLAETVLHLRSFGVRDVAAFAWLEAPSTAAIDAAEQLLRRLGAIGGAEGGLTDVGRAMLRLPLPPRLARLVVEAEARGVAAGGCGIAAILAEGRDLYPRSIGGGGGGGGGGAGAGGVAASIGDASSDLLVRLADLDAVTRGGLDEDRARRWGLDVGVVASVDRTRRQLLRLCAQQSRRGPAALATSIDEDDALRIATLAAFPDRVAQRRASSTNDTRMGASPELVMCTGGSATLADTSVVTTAPWLVAAEARDQRAATIGGAGRSIGAAEVARGARVRVWLASAIDPAWLIELFPDAVREDVDVRWNAEAERVEATERMTYDRLVLDERPAGRAADDAAARLLAERAMAVGLSEFMGGRGTSAASHEGPEARGAREALDRLAARIAFVLRTAPDLAARVALEPLDEPHLEALLRARCQGKRGFAELRAEPLLDDLRAHVGAPALALLDDLAPELWRFPNGRRAKIAYSIDQPPSVASRLQDFFGSTESPRVARGRVPLVLHLLAPNGRDVQITTDLAGFWSKHYPAIRSELARKYPRHPWPADPVTASPPVQRR